MLRNKSQKLEHKYVSATQSWLSVLTTNAWGLYTQISPVLGVRVCIQGQLLHLGIGLLEVKYWDIWDKEHVC